jgi:thiol-disulfide isomerase/thioredoxin
MTDHQSLETRPSERPSRIWLLLALGFVVFWILYLVLLGPRAPDLSLEKSGLSRPAEYDWTVFDLNDERVPFSRFKGKPVFLNFWATFCPPCIEEMPSIARLAEDPRLRGKGIEFVCVSTDVSSDVVRRFLAGHSWSMTFLRTESLPIVFSTQGLPATFIIAPDGRVAAAIEGADRWDTPKVVAFLEKIAAVKPTPPAQ